MLCSNIQTSASVKNKKIKRVTFSQLLLRMFIGIVALICVLPVVLIVIVAFSSESSVAEIGFSYIPKEWSFEACRYVLKFSDQLIRAYGITIWETVFGSLLTVFITSMFAYVLSRRDFKLNKYLTKFVIFTTLFSGGMLGSYLINTNIYGLKNNLLVLILPHCVTAWNTVVMRTFVRSNVPQALIESAEIDGAGEIYTFFKIVMPIMVPVMASIGFMSAVSHWNEWQTAYLYLDSENYSTLQLVLIKIEKDIDFLRKNSGTLSTEDILALKDIPSESARMAILLFSIAPIMIAYPFFQKYFIKGITVGSVKG
ncbi:MAG: carbohydrate ABC transporter permease [Clostridia bacterium]|nr:carbohydrate ABC transporter permease [Clostridia bacterium]